MLLASSFFLDLLILFSGFLAFLYYYLTKDHNYWKKRGIPFIKPTVLGSFPEVFTLRKSVGIAYRDLHLKMDFPFMGIFVLHKPHLIIKDTNLIKSVLIEGYTHFQDRNVVSTGEHDTLGSHMLFFMASPEWGTYRRKISPVYTHGKIKSMYCLFEEVGTQLVDYLSNKLDETDTVDFKDIASRYSCELITSTAFGLNANAFNDAKSEFFKAGKQILDFKNIYRAISISCYLMVPAAVSLFRLMLVDPESASFLRYAFWKTLKQRQESQIVRNDLIDSLIQLKKQDENIDLEGDKVLAQAVVFFLGGFETTSTTIVFALYELANQPECQTKLRDELKNAIKIHGSLNYDMFNDGTLKYLDMVVKETLRKYPSIPFLDRKCNKEFPIPGTDKVIEKGVGIYISVIGLHMDADNFPNPEKFDPERFSEENFPKIKPYTYLPYGEGPRICIGGRFGTLGTKYAIANIILNFEMECCKQTPEKIEFHRQSAILSPLGAELIMRYKKICT